MPTTVDVAGVSKRFRLYHEKYQSLKERVIHFGRIPHEDFWALRDVSFDIQQGETFALFGPNGSGKSTLLKCIAGILRPTEGQIRTEGRLAALLELGAGFHPDLTGRENVYLNASILGFSNREIERKFDDIVAFAELEQFIDNQVKHYSSGMYVRLGFAVAIHMDPEVLLIDEVLAVGDEAFQRKCLDRIKQFQREGRTIVLVTHAPDVARQICDRAAVLDHGHLLMAGDTTEAVRTLRDVLFAVGESAPGLEDGDSPAGRRNLRIRIGAVEVDHPGGAERDYLLPGEAMTLRIRYEAAEPVQEPVFGVAIHDDEGRLVFGTNTEILGSRMGTVEGPGVVSFVFESVPLLEGRFAVTIGATNEAAGIVYDWWEQKVRFVVVNDGRDSGRVRLPVRVRTESRRLVPGEPVPGEPVPGEPVPGEAAR